MSKVYILEYEILVNKYGVDMHGSMPKYEERQDYFNEKEKSDFIKKFEYLAAKDYVTNLKAYTAETKEITEDLVTLLSI